MKGFIVIFKKELLEQMRSNKILILSFLFLFISISSVILAKVLPEILNKYSTPGLIISLPTPSYKDAIDQFMKNISQIGLLVIVFLVAGAISEEKNKKTLELLLSKPVSRTSFIVAKFLSYFFTIGIIYTISSLIFFFYTSSAFGPFDFIYFLTMAKMTLLYMLLLASITLFFSALAKNTLSAAVYGFLGMIVVTTASSIFPKIEKYNPYYLISSYKDIIENGWSNSYYPAALICVGLILILIILAIFSFRKQEVER